MEGNLEIVIGKDVDVFRLAREISMFSDIIRKFPDDSLIKKFLDACKMVVAVATLSSYKNNFERGVNSVNEERKQIYCYSFVQQVYYFIKSVSNLINFNYELLSEVEKCVSTSNFNFGSSNLNGILALASRVANEIDKIAKEFNVNSIVNKLKDLLSDKKEIGKYSIEGRSYVVKAYEDATGIHLLVTYT